MIASASSAWPLPATAAMPDDLPGVHLERDVPQRREAAVVAGRDPFDRQHDATRLDGRALQGLEDRTPDHQAGEVGPGDAGGVHVRGGDLAGAHDGDPVRDREDLAQLVADEDDAPAGRGHGPERDEQLLGLLGREDRGGLVHDQDAGAAVEHLEDLDALLLPDGQLPDARPGVDAEPDVPGDRLDLRLGPAEVEAEPGLLHAEQHVLGHGLRGHEREVLVDHADPAGDGVARRAERHGLPVEAQLSLVGLVEPGQDVHERGLAGAVLAEQRVDLARADVEIDVVVGEDAREGLDDADGLEGGGDGWGGHGRSRSTAVGLAARAGTTGGSRSSRPADLTTAAAARC